ncbi:MAG: ubiquinol-cytochrome c reductase iron-sulfur subunit [Terriglobia bacterium]
MTDSEVKQQKTAGRTSPAGAPPTQPTTSGDGKPPVEPVKLRRRLIWSFVWGYLGVNFLMFLRFFFPRTLFEPKTRFIVGTATDFGLGVDERFLQQYRIWVVRKPDRLFVIYARCTHLGCTPDWKARENKFKCPCHGSGYDTDGINFEGPAPRPMDRAHLELNPQNQIVVDVGRLYKQEKGKVDQFEKSTGRSGAFLVV